MVAFVRISRGHNCRPKTHVEADLHLQKVGILFRLVLARMTKGSIDLCSLELNTRHTASELDAKEKDTTYLGFYQHLQSRIALLLELSIKVGHEEFREPNCA